MYTKKSLSPDFRHKSKYKQRQTHSLPSLITNTAHASEAQVVAHKLHKVVPRQNHLPGRCITSEQTENKTKRRNNDANYQHIHIKHQVHLIVPKTPKRLKKKGNEIGGTNWWSKSDHVILTTPQEGNDTAFEEENNEVDLKIFGRQQQIN